MREVRTQDCLEARRKRMELFGPHKKHTRRVYVENRRENMLTWNAVSLRFTASQVTSNRIYESSGIATLTITIYFPLRNCPSRVKDEVGRNVSNITRSQSR